MARRYDRRPALRSIAERNALVEANLLLASWAAKRFLCLREGLRGYPFDEAHADALDGLIRACELWDESRGAISTYAWRWMRQHMSRGAWLADIVTRPNQRGRDSRQYAKERAARYESDRKLDEIVYGEDPLAAMIAEERIEALRQALADLAVTHPQESAVIRLHKSGLTFREIGERMGCSYGSARLLEVKGLARLRELLDEWRDV